MIPCLTGFIDQPRNNMKIVFKRHGFGLDKNDPIDRQLINTLPEHWREGMKTEHICSRTTDAIIAKAREFPDRYRISEVPNKESLLPFVSEHPEHGECIRSLYGIGIINPCDGSIPFDQS